MLLSDTGGGPLGTGSGTGYTRATCSLTKGDGVLLAGSAVHRATSTFDDPDRMVESLASGLSSDQALSVVGASLRTEPHRDLEVPLDGEVDPVRCAREQLGYWLAELGASPMDQMGERTPRLSGDQRVRARRTRPRPVGRAASPPRLEPASPWSRCSTTARGKCPSRT